MERESIGGREGGRKGRRCVCMKALARRRPEQGGKEGGRARRLVVCMYVCVCFRVCVCV